MAWSITWRIAILYVRNTFAPFAGAAGTNGTSTCRMIRCLGVAASKYLWSGTVVWLDATGSKTRTAALAPSSAMAASEGNESPGVEWCLHSARLPPSVARLRIDVPAMRPRCSARCAKVHVAPGAALFALRKAIASWMVHSAPMDACVACIVAPSISGMRPRCRYTTNAVRHAW